LSHYFSSQPDAASAPGHIGLVLPDVTLELETDRGVFAREGVDRGTKLLLLEGPWPPLAGNVLDLGCGYGPIAVTLARRAPAAMVWAVDVNERARRLTTANAAANGVANVRVAAPDAVPDDIRFAAIYSNPPVRIGKQALHDLLSRWLPRLTVDGHGFLVVNKNLGADSLARWLRDTGYLVERLCSRMGYRVLAVGTPPDAAEA
jgi:16S rRNA G1207 methylase RsmC